MNKVITGWQAAAGRGGPAPAVAAEHPGTAGLMSLALGVTATALLLGPPLLAVVSSANRCQHWPNACTEQALDQHLPNDQIFSL